MPQAFQNGMGMVDPSNDSFTPAPISAGWDGPTHRLLGALQELEQNLHRHLPSAARKVRKEGALPNTEAQTSPVQKASRLPSLCISIGAQLSSAQNPVRVGSTS